MDEVGNVCRKRYKGFVPLAVLCGLDGLVSRVIVRFKTISLWHIVWITIIAAEIATAAMNTIMGYVWWGSFSPDLVLIGTVDAFVVSLLVSPFIIYIVARLLEIENDAAAQSLRLEGDRKFQMLMEQASDGIGIMAPEGNITSVNTRLCEMFGYSYEEFLRLGLEDLVLKDELDLVYADIALMKAGKTVMREREALRKDGTYFPVEVSAKMLEDGSLQAIVRDITGRKRAEEERGRMQEQLLKAQKMEAIGTLAGGVAHDFNNLLTVIKGESEMAIADAGKDSPHYFNLCQINKAAARAAELTRKLLLFSRRKPMASVKLNLNAVVEEMLSMLRSVIGEDTEITLSLRPGLWGVLADPGSIEQVIMNLVVNARDAMPGGGRLTIKTENVTLEGRQADYVRLTVADTGAGMDKETLQHVFEPFFSGRESRKGTGLGLAVVYGIVEQHEGWIDVKSEPGKGATFEVYLKPFHGTGEERPGAPVRLDGLQGKGERILLVEDEGDVSNLASRALSENGYVVFTAFGFQEAVRIFEMEKGDFSLLFSDVVLPDRSGLQLAERLRSIKPGLPVLFCSGYTDKKSQWPVIREQGYPFLEKPYLLQDLLAAVRGAILAAG